MKEILTNEKFVAIAAITLILVTAMYFLKLDAKDIILPAITGICGFVGPGVKRAEYPTMDAAIQAGTDKLQAEQVKAVEAEKP